MMDIEQRIHRRKQVNLQGNIHLVKILNDLMCSSYASWKHLMSTFLIIFTIFFPTNNEILRYIYVLLDQAQNKLTHLFLDLNSHGFY